MPTHTCKNCGQTFELEYCNACGQKEAHRLDMKHVAHEVFHVFTHTDKSVLRFIPQILLYPGTTALNYVNGQRKKYFNVFQYLIIVAGLVALIMSKTHLIGETTKQFQTQKLPPRIAVLQEKITHFQENYFNVMVLLLIPLIATFTMAFFRKKKYNYAECAVLQCYIQAQSNTISLITMPLIYLLSAGTMFQITFIPMILNLVTNTIAFRQFFKTSWLESALKSILIYACLFASIAIIVFAIVILAVLVMK